MTFQKISEAAANFQIVDCAVRSRKNKGICDRSVFGDCRETAQETVRLLSEVNVPAQLSGGQFICDPEADIEFDHSWVTVNGAILDPTVDQFAVDLDVGLHTKTLGVTTVELKSREIQRYLKKNLQ